MRWTSAVGFSVAVLCATSTRAATYYVSLGGDDSDGQSPATAWTHLDRLNGFDFADGDEVLVRAGDTFDDAVVTLAGVGGAGKTITIRGADFPSDGRTIAADGKPWIDANVIQPFRVSNSSVTGIVLKDLNLDGMDFSVGPWPMGYGHVTLDGMLDVLLDGVDIDGHRGATEYPDKYWFIGIMNPADGGTIEIRNCELTNGRPDPVSYPPEAWNYDVPGWIDKDHYFVHVFSHPEQDAVLATGTLAIHDNVMDGTWADCIHLKNVKNTNSIAHNVLAHFGENAIDLKSCENTDIHHNEMYRGAYGKGGSGSGGATITTHDRASTGNPTRYLLIHDNYFHTNTYSVIRPLFPSHDFQVYNNLFAGCGCGVQLAGSAGVHDIAVYNNVFLQDALKDPDANGTAATAVWIYNSNGGNLQIHNNTIYSTHPTQRAGIRLDARADRAGVEVLNNVVVMTQDDASVSALDINAGGESLRIEHNTYHTPGSAIAVNHAGDTSWTSWAASHPADRSEDPLLSDPAGGQLWPLPNSPVIDTGSDSEISVRGLRHDSDWQTWPIDVRTVLRADHGGSDRGAYEQTPTTDCTDGEVRRCGPDTGACVPGEQTCAGGTWGACLGGVGPRAEECNGVDDDCDALTDEDFPSLGDACIAGVGTCQASGFMVCTQAGDGTECDAVPGMPGVEVCCTQEDEDCDGIVDNGCACCPGDDRSCYAGPPGTRDVGECVAGTQACTGGVWGACTGQVLPEAEACADGMDNDCDGHTDEDCSDDPEEPVDGSCGCAAGTSRLVGQHGSGAPVSPASLLAIMILVILSRTTCRPR